VLLILMLGSLVAPFLTLLEEVNYWQVLLDMGMALDTVDTEAMEAGVDLDTVDTEADTEAGVDLNSLNMLVYKANQYLLLTLLEKVKNALNAMVEAFRVHTAAGMDTEADTVDMEDMEAGVDTEVDTVDHIQVTVQVMVATVQTGEDMETQDPDTGMEWIMSHHKSKKLSIKMLVPLVPMFLPLMDTTTESDGVDGVVTVAMVLVTDPPMAATAVMEDLAIRDMEEDSMEAQLELPT
jgi:hypothetical protein